MTTYASKPAVNKRTGALLPAYARAAIYSIVWLPALGLIAFLDAMFGDRFSSLRDSAELPAITEWLHGFSRLNGSLFYVPSVLVLVVLMLADISVVSLSQSSSRKWLHSIWFGAVVVMGIVAAAVVATALLLPFLK